MRTDLSQYYHCNNPSVRLQYQTSEDEKVNFEVNGTKLLLRDINTFCTTKVNARNIMEKLRTLALNNNTSGATIYDLANVVKAESVAEITEIMKSIEEKVQQEKQDEYNQQQQLQQQQEEAAQQAKMQQQQFDSDQNDKNRQTEIIVAEIRAAGNGNGQDVNGNNVNDYMDSLEFIQKQQAYQDEVNLKREAASDKRTQHTDNIQLQREKIQAEDRRADKQVQVARINKNKYDKPKSK
jgi:hypothetical protein